MCAPEAQIAIIDRSNPEAKITTDYWQKVEERLFIVLIAKFKSSQR